MAVDPNIQKKADDIRNKIYGKEVRESLASGLEEMSSDVVENEGRQSVVEGRQDSVESQWQAVSDEMTDKDIVSAPEIIAARNGEANLKTRLDEEHQEVTTQLAQDKRFIKHGVLNLPTDFPTLPFNITKEGKYDFNHNATPHTQFNWEGAIEVFVDHRAVVGNTGLTIDSPVSLGRFLVDLDNGNYSNYNKIIVSFLSNVHYHSATEGVNNKNINILFRSISPSGFTWIVPSASSVLSNGKPHDWSLVEGVYRTEVSNTQPVVDVINFDSVDGYGIPKPYERVNSLENCKNTRGSFYSSGGVVYSNPYAGQDIDKTFVNFDRKTLTVSGTTGVTIFENMGFTTGSYEFKPTNASSTFYYFGCKFYRGKENAFAITGAYSAYVFDCVAAYGSRDGFNYNSTTPDSLAVEINSIAYGSGQYKLAGGNTTTHSNNGSTGHDGIYMLRVGGQYWDCEGPVVADEDCYSISIGCQVFDILETTTTNNLRGFNLYNVNYDFKKIVAECSVSGKHFTHSVGGNGDFYSLNIESEYPKTGLVNEMQSWEDILNV